jgi:hypothetical protein
MRLFSKCLPLNIKLNTTRKTTIGRNIICGAPKGACPTKLFLWRMKTNAPHKFWRFCGACTAGAPQKLSFLWRMCTDAPQKLCGTHAGSTTAHGRRVFCGACTNMRHRNSNFCHAPQNILWGTTTDFTRPCFRGAYANMHHRSPSFCGAY